MLAAWERLKRQSSTVREAKRARSRAKRKPGYRYRFKSSITPSTLSITFRQTTATLEDVLEIMDEARADLEEHGLPE
jgi:hypothetical protein